MISDETPAQSVNGPIPDGLFACHTCDNPPCVNTAHLFLGTTRDNALDAKRKGRLNPAMFDGTMPSIGGRARAEHPVQGSAHPMARLTEDDVREMRRLRAEGMTQRELAERFHVNARHVGDIVRREKWAHVV